MTFAEFVDLIEQLLVLAALVGAISSAFAFVNRWKQDKEAARQSNVAKWRKVNVQKILTTDPQFLSALQVLDRLRSDSFDSEIDIRRDELSEAAIRELLIDMVSAGIVVQRHGDMYGVKQDKFDVGAVAAEEQLLTHIPAICAIELIGQYPAHFDDAKLLDEVKNVTGLNSSGGRFWFAMTEIVERGVAYRNSDGKWMLGKED